MSKIIFQHLTCREYSEDTATCAFFIPSGFCHESKKSLAHLTEHCLLAITKTIFLPNPQNKPDFLLFNAATTSYYTCIWFTSPVNIYRDLHKLFIEAITKIPDNIYLINMAMIDHERDKISYELKYLKELNESKRQFKNSELLEETGLSVLTENDIKNTIEGYVQKTSLLIEYGGREEFNEIKDKNLQCSPQIHIMDNKHIILTEVDSLQYIHAIRFIAYIVNKKGISVQVKQHIEKSILIIFSEHIGSVIKMLEKLTPTQFQYYLEDYYAYERKDCNDNFQFIKRLYKYYRQTGYVCNRKQWYSAIYNIAEFYKKLILHMKES